MRRLVITCVLAIWLFGLIGITSAEQVDKPFLNVSTKPDKIDLGTASLFKDTLEVPAALKVMVESNCMHGPIMISATKLKRREGGSISPERIYVKSSATNGFVPIARPVAISKPEIGSHEIVLDLKVETKVFEPAGEYSGTLMLTITPSV